MWRAFFLAIGLSFIILGAEFMMLDKVVFHEAPREGGALNILASVTSTKIIAAKTYEPPDWTPWSLFSVGAIVMIYSFTIPQRVKD